MSALLVLAAVVGAGVLLALASWFAGADSRDYFRHDWPSADPRC